MPRSLRQLAATPVTELKGVGPERGKALANLDVTSVLDLLTYYPRRYLDRTRQARIADVRVGEEATVLVEVKRSSARRTRNGKSLVTVDVSDESGPLKLTFFNQPWRERQLRPGAQVLLFGKVDTYQGRKQMSSPVVDLVGDRTGKIIPVYPQSDKARIYTWDVAKWIEEALSRAGEFAEPVSPNVLDRFDFVDRSVAFRGIHSPDSMPQMAEARRRLVFDELLRLQLSLVLRKRAIERTSVGIAHDLSGDLVRRFHDGLPFALTGAQQRVIEEITADLARPVPMHRLLQGDVGSGKTFVAVSAMLVAVQGGHQAALMAPTEVLAEQHALSIRPLLEGFELGDDGTTLFGARPLQVDLLTNRTTPTERKRLHARLASGETNILIGTHALIQDAVAFRSLGVVVIDEQHKFGVEQRAALREKGAGDAVPDVLVMTATPIPRTAAMTVYGALDVSTIDELPPGREKIATTWEKAAPGDLTLNELSVWATVRDEVAAGRQAYVVCPLIDESEKLEVRSAEATYAELVEGELAGLRLGLIHGRVPAAEKEKVMTSFREGTIDVLVATTVIEVGVDVPNATVMVILDADRFGIAQLHQLRGRVGRGAGLKSYCFLVGAGATAEGEQRLDAMVKSDDGFVLAEVDLDIRGEGTIMGERQKGRNDLKLASLRRDREWVQPARDAAIEIVHAGPTLAEHPLLLEEIESFLGEDERDFLLKS